MQMEAINKNTILAISIVLEAGLLLVAAVWINLSHLQLLSKFSLNPQAFLWGLAFSILSTAVSLCCFALGKRLGFFAELRKMTQDFLLPILALLGPQDILFLALLSGFCEEVFFRGVMQAHFGLLLSSLVFGVFHDPTLKQKAYVILTFIAGLGLGYLYQLTGNLWSCISAHVLHNLLAMLLLRYCIKVDDNAG